jgi:hypothetical protein
MSCSMNEAWRKQRNHDRCANIVGSQSCVAGWLKPEGWRFAVYTVQWAILGFVRHGHHHTSDSRVHQLFRELLRTDEIYWIKLISSNLGGSFFRSVRFDIIRQLCSSTWRFPRCSQTSSLEASIGQKKFVPCGQQRFWSTPSVPKRMSF